jgi:Family of unknown function (DUF5678)
LDDVTFARRGVAMGAKPEMKKLVPRKHALLRGKKLKGAIPSYDPPPPELAGKWIAWSKDGRLVASGETLEEVMALVASKKIKGASYEPLPLSVRGR